MMNINMMIANNVLDILEEQGKKKSDLADGIGISKQTMSKMLDGGYTIGVEELKRVASYLKVPMERLMEPSETSTDIDVFKAMMDRVDTEEAKETIRVAEEVSDMILFHRRVREKGTAMMQICDEL